jgi:hypothetical protein
MTFAQAIRRLVELGLKAKGEKIVMLSAMQYPHWLMVAGAALVVIGFAGFAFGQNRTVEPDHQPTEEGET